MTSTTTEKFVLAANEPKDDRDTAPGRLLDLMIMVLTIDAFESNASQPKGKDISEFLSKGSALYRMHRGSIEEASKKHLESLMERSDAGPIKARFRLMDQVDPVKKARFIEEFMVWIKKRTTLMRDVFPGRCYANAAKVAAACEETDPGLRVQRLACVATSSGLSSMFKWVRKGAELLGSPAPTAQAVAAQAEGAQSIADDLREVERKLNVEPPGTTARVELEDKRLDLSADLNEAVGESDDPPTVNSAATSRLAAQSEVSKKFGLTSEQEDVMRSMGKVCIAAGAGSGKTQTLVATIAHLVQDLDYSPDQIMACSFTKAASTELENRVLERAGVRGARIGTTHSIAREIIVMSHPELAIAVDNASNADALFRVAMKQVPLNLEAYNAKLDKSKEMMARIEAIPGWREDSFLSSLYSQCRSGRTLSEKQVAAIEKAEARARNYGRRKYAGAETPEARAILAALEASLAARPIEASDEDEDEGSTSKKLPASKYLSTPVGMWFNIGRDIVDENEKPIGEKTAKLLVDNFKNSGMTLEEVRAELGDTNPIAALYGAYEWLKRNDPTLGPAMDFTDQLIHATKILREEPRVREAQQRRFKAIMVDEAQDLNQIQFDMFNLLGEKADLLAFIGDDKQSIYGFRGAKPENYIGLSKSEGYQTKLLSMNFRSGKAIVDAANKLIAHNEDRQIPMVCDADVERKGIGSIQSRYSGTHEDAASEVAEEIKGAVDSGDSPSDFGILVRNNAEHDAYTLALLVRGIPYRLLKKSEGGYFGKPMIRAMTSWMRLCTGGSKAEINEAVLNAHMTPGFFLDKEFAASLASKCFKESYLDYILAGKPVYFGQADWRNKNVRAYADAIRTLTAAGGMDSLSIVRAILGVKGATSTFEEALIRLVDEEDLTSNGEEPTPEAIRGAAMAPLSPLMTMAASFKDPDNFLAFVDKMKAANEKTQQKTPNKAADWKEPAVLIGTIHGWKGLQAKHCYVCMAGGVFPNYRNEEKAELSDETALDEERRLAYVAITRGEDSVTVISPQINYLGKEAPLPRFVAEACIPVVGEKDEAKLNLDPKDDGGVTEETPAFEAKTASRRVKKGSFAMSLTSYGFDFQACGDDCNGSCEGDCGDDCEGDCDCKTEGTVTCPCELV